MGKEDNLHSLIDEQRSITEKEARLIRSLIMGCANRYSSLLSRLAELFDG